MKVGDPVDLRRSAATGVGAALNEATEVLMDAIAALLSQTSRRTGAGRTVGPTQHGQKETGRLES